MNRFLLDTRGHDIYDILDFNLWLNFLFLKQDNRRRWL
jgi:hypothetical protein